MTKIKNLVDLAKYVYRQTISYNKELQKKVPELKGFYWPEWNDLSTELQWEKIRTLYHSYIFKKVTEISVTRKHNLITSSRMADGWILEEERDDKRKYDPYLKPLIACPGWVYEWSFNRDKIEMSIINKEIYNTLNQCNTKEK
jgi:hypothetical protein